VVAPGGIAHAFASALRIHTAQQLVAVGSRSHERAQAYADEFEIPRAYGSYQQLVDDPDVDVVYVASPHSEHRRQALLAIAAGKHVLVEKAFTPTAAEAAEVFAAGDRAGVAVMEAMWSRFLPHYDVVRQLLADGALGDLTTVVADHGQHMAYDPSSRLFDPKLAGGALLDLGIYPLSFAALAQGTPTSIHAVGTATGTGVDGQVSTVLTSEGDVHALISTTLFARTPTTASVTGTFARIEIPGDFYTPQPVTLIDRSGERRVWDANRIHGHEGLAFQAAELARVIADGRRESTLMPASETVSILATIDEIRRQIGTVALG